MPDARRKAWISAQYRGSLRASTRSLWPPQRSTSLAPGELAASRRAWDGGEDLVPEPVEDEHGHSEGRQDLGRPVGVLHQHRRRAEAPGHGGEVGRRGLEDERRRPPAPGEVGDHAAADRAAMEDDPAAVHVGSRPEEVVEPHHVAGDRLLPGPAGRAAVSPVLAEQHGDPELAVAAPARSSWWSIHSAFPWAKSTAGAGRPGEASGAGRNQASTSPSAGSASSRGTRIDWAPGGGPASPAPASPGRNTSRSWTA